MHLHLSLHYPTNLINLIYPFFGGSNSQPRPSAFNRDIGFSCNRGHGLHLLALFDLSAMTYSHLFNLIVLYCFIYSNLLLCFALLALLFFLRTTLFVLLLSDLLPPLCSTSFFSTCIHSVLLWSALLTPSALPLCSTLIAPLILISAWSDMHSSLGLTQFGSAWSALLCLSLPWAF